LLAHHHETGALGSFAEDGLGRMHVEVTRRTRFCVVAEPDEVVLVVRRMPSRRFGHVVSWTSRANVRVRFRTLPVPNGIGSIGQHRVQIAEMCTPRFGFRARPRLGISLA